MLKNLKVYEKLAVGFGVLLLLAVIIAATSLNRLSHIKEDVVDNILNDRYPKIALANESIQLTLNNARLIRNAILLTDHEEIESNIRRAEENRKLNSAALEKM
ncbi:MAG: hypothetical protein D3M94_17385 [Rhodocyclales bacterium GT-UBC]|nr:MAG: hypothetical protein D3M94_17385 [Rhodocyclales bacterium GT-UBC]